MQLLFPNLEHSLQPSPHCFCLVKATPTAYGSSQARGLIRSVAAGLHQSHSNAGSERFLLHSSWQRQILNPLSEIRNQTLNLMVPSQINLHCATMETPPLRVLFRSASSLVCFICSPLEWKLRVGLARAAARAAQTRSVPEYADCLPTPALSFTCINQSIPSKAVKYRSYHYHPPFITKKLNTERVSHLLKATQL